MGNVISVGNQRDESGEIMSHRICKSIDEFKSLIWQGSNLTSSTKQGSRKGALVAFPPNKRAFATKSSSDKGFAVLYLLNIHACCPK